MTKRMTNQKTDVCRKHKTHFQEKDFMNGYSPTKHKVDRPSTLFPVHTLPHLAPWNVYCQQNSNSINKYRLPMWLSICAAST